MNVTSAVLPFHLREFRDKILSRFSDVVELFFGEIPPLLETENEIREYLAGRDFSSRVFSKDFMLRCDPDFVSVVQYCVIPFVYMAHPYQSLLFYSGPIMPGLLTAFSLLENIYVNVRKTFRQVVVPDVSVSVIDGQCVIPSVDPVVSCISGRVIGITSDDKEIIPEVPPAISSWIDSDPLDLKTYVTKEYEEVELRHSAFAREIRDRFPTDYFIVPGDGSGLFARLSTVPSAYGDPVVRSTTHPSVKFENFEDTLRRGIQESRDLCQNPILILSYVAYWVDPALIPSSMRVLVIDHPKHMSKFDLRPISQNVFANFPMDPLVISPDKFKRPRKYHVRFLKNLLAVRGPRILTLSPSVMVYIRSLDIPFYSDNPIVQEFIVSSGRSLAEDYEVTVVDSLSQVDSFPVYHIPSGTRLNDIYFPVEWDGISPIRSRTFYKVPPVYLPPVFKIEKFKSIDLVYVDDEYSLIRRNYVTSERVLGDIRCLPYLDREYYSVESIRQKYSHVFHQVHDVSMWNRGYVYHVSREDYYFVENDGYYPMGSFSLDFPRKFEFCSKTYFSLREVWELCKLGSLGFQDASQARFRALLYGLFDIGALSAVVLKFKPRNLEEEQYCQILRSIAGY